MEGILATIKKARGVAQSDDSFDVDLLLYINTCLFILSQLGVKEADATPIVDETTTWTDLLGTRTDLEVVKTYLDLKTKMMFDPPTNSAAAEACNRSIAEMEWRITNLDRNKGVILSG